MKRETEPRISVIIPHYKQEELLAICLSKLEKQTLTAKLYEVVVVDNSDRPIATSFQKKFPQVRFLHEKTPGSYAARNHGIRQTKSPILVFTDSDCQPQADWLENGLNLFEAKPGADLIGGNIEIVFRQPQRPNAVELYDSTNYMQQEWYTTLGFAICANFFIKRELFEQHGLFNEALKSGGDLAFGQKMTSAGYRLVYGADVTILHPARHKWSDFVTLHRRLYGGRWTTNLDKTAKTIFPVNRFGISRTISQAWQQVAAEKKLTSMWQKALIFLMHQLVTVIELREYVRLSRGKETERS